MADSSKSKRTGLRQPTTVSVNRKSRSFNANDKNRINLDDASNGSVSRLSPTSPVNVFNGASPQSRIAEPSATSPWRSKSMSAKHSATTRLLAPKSHTPTLQTFKPNTVTSQSSNPSSSAASMTSESSLADIDTKQIYGAGDVSTGTSRLHRATRKPPTANGSRIEM
uniref:Uncharacterized protein n=2 Tax=Ciona intestinalis TaxID=7719 RepID=H2XW05_CIOIN